MARLFAAALVALGVGLLSLATLSPSSGSVDVILKEWKVDATVSTHLAGAVTFNLDSRGAILHEFVIIQTDTLARDLVAQVDPTTLRLDEERFTSPGEYGDLPVGTTAVVTIDLAPGHYVMMCNIAGHYDDGMYADLTIVRP